MEEIGKKYDINFAFDADAFSVINTKFTINNSSIENLLELLKTNYSVDHKLIESTWILVLVKKNIPVVVPAKPKPVTFSGYVKDAVTGEDLIYCNVVYGNNQGAMTNELGFFSFQVPKRDSLNIKISHLGYNMLDTIILPSEKAGFYLKPSDVLLPAVEVLHQENNVIQASPRPESIGFNL